MSIFIHNSRFDPMPPDPMLPHLYLRTSHAWNAVLDRTPHTDQSNWSVLDQHTTPVISAFTLQSTEIALYFNN
jgi:hypothetical protein